MIDLLIIKNPTIQWVDDKHDEYNAACVLGDVPLILLNPQPKEAFWYAEETIETLVEHETLEHILKREELINESSSPPSGRCSLRNIHDLDGWKFDKQNGAIDQMA